MNGPNQQGTQSFMLLSFSCLTFCYSDGALSVDCVQPCPCPSGEWYLHTGSEGLFKNCISDRLEHSGKGAGLASHLIFCEHCQE